MEYKIVVNITDKNSKKLKHKTHSVVFNIQGFKRAEIVHYQEVEGGGYDLYLNNGVDSANEPHLLSPDEAITLIVDQSAEWKKDGYGKNLQIIKLELTISKLILQPSQKICFLRT